MYKINMSHTRQDRSHQNHWQLLFQQATSAESGAEPQYLEPLSNVLRPLEVPYELIGRICASINDALPKISRASQDSHEARVLLLQVYVPRERESPVRPNQNWGFFWIKKSGEGPDGAASHEARIEVYLYPDG
jgi:hypothetical protein